MVIIKAAIMFQNGEIVEGHSYSEISTLASKLSFSGEKIYGFVTSSGEFVLPEEAVSIALESKQISAEVDKLTPDMLWPWLRED